MADTTNYGWTKPTVGGDSGAWGTILNALFDDVDSDVKSVEDKADAALPKAGGAMTGRLDGHSGTIKLVAKGSISGAQSLDLSTGQYFTATITGNTTFSVTNVPSGTFATPLFLRLTNAGAHTITWPASFRWPGGGAPSLTSSGVDMLAFVTDDNGTTWRNVAVVKNIA